MIEISTDKARIDIAFVQQYLRNVPWEAARTIEDVNKTIDSSFCFGVYLDNKQIGFARVITDYVVLAYLMDVYIDEAHRGKGYASTLMGAMMEDPKLKKVKIWRLASRDAQEFYHKLGFSLLAHPERMMEKIVEV